MIYAVGAADPTENGEVRFIGNGMYKIDFEYKDHTIRCIFKQSTGQFHQIPDAKPGITVLYDDEDVSSKYLEYLDERNPVPVNTNLDNLAVVIDVINRNLEHYIEENM